MKKFLSLTAAITLTVSTLVVPAAQADASFTDLGADHWAHASVSRLVESGTINGYDDGTFLPDATVTRAEFVKMLGKSNEKRETEFEDIASDHWAYDYIMYSGLEGDSSNSFNPDAAITRADVAKLLYKRYALGANAVAPYPITGSGDASTAAAWVYNSGLMLGDDMVNLRLEDSLTRAEAAVLIVRAQDLDLTQKRNFIDNFSDEAYEKIYTLSELFDSEYKADEGITNGEAACAALRFQYKEKNPLYAHYSYDVQFEGSYAKQWAVMTKYALEGSKLTNTEADCKKNATVADVIAMFSIACKNNEYVALNIDTSNNDVYPELSEIQQGSYRNALSYAYNYGISLYADAKINADRPITKKELACIVMQYDAAFGANIAYRCGYNCTYEPTPIRRDAASYPSNAQDYTVILNDIPNSVYEPSFKDVKGKPSDFTKGGKSIANIFINPLIDLCAAAYNNGNMIYITYYPTIAANTDSGYAYRVKFEIESVVEGTKLSDVIKLGENTDDFVLANGDVFFADVHSNAYLSGLYLDSQLFTAERVIR